MNDWPTSDTNFETKYKVKSKHMQLLHIQLCTIVAYFSRQTRYKGTPRNVYRHIVVSEIKEATSALPPVCKHSCCSLNTTYSVAW